MCSVYRLQPGTQLSIVLRFSTQPDTIQPVSPSQCYCPALYRLFYITHSTAPISTSFNFLFSFLGVLYKAKEKITPYVETTSIRPSARPSLCDLVTKLSAAFSWNSAQNFFTKSPRTSVGFVKIAPETERERERQTDMLYLKA